jgi:hypothetical protein
MPDPSRPPPPACWCGDTHRDDCPEKAREEAAAKILAHFGLAQPREERRG